MSEAKKYVNVAFNAYAVPDYWRYVALGLLALYFLKDYILD